MIDRAQLPFPQVLARPVMHTFWKLYRGTSLPDLYYTCLLVFLSGAYFEEVQMTQVSIQTRLSVEYECGVWFWSTRIRDRY